ncbi:hypothetical protein [Streptomyces sp. NPDC005538]|uniref:hypothetical protein n=1 Tax=unclassified Streptomyces TaxID=2593676 RepID=UPI0033B60F97
MASRRTVSGAVSAAALLAMASGSAATVADTSQPSPRPYVSFSTVEHLNVGSVEKRVDANWNLLGIEPNDPPQTDETLVIDARDLAGVADVTVDDPRCEAAGRVFTCVSKAALRGGSVELSVRADAGAAPGADGTLTYTVSAGHAKGATARTKVIAGLPNLIVGKLPDVTHAKVGSRIEVPLRIGNIGDLATDGPLMLRWASVGGLGFDRKFSNCVYGEGDGPGVGGEPSGQTSVDCVVTTPVAAGATMELSSPLTATVGTHVLHDVTTYSAAPLEPGEDADGGAERGAGPALTLVPASCGPEGGSEGRFTVTADNSADLAAKAKPVSGTGEWTLDIEAVDHGPASVYNVGAKAAAVVDVVLPEGTVATGNVFAESEDGFHGECRLWAGPTSTAAFQAGHRHYVCFVPFRIVAGRSQSFVLRGKTTKGYDGARGTVTVRPGPAGLRLHDPDPSNDSATFAFGR